MPGSVTKWDSFAKDCRRRYFRLAGNASSIISPSEDYHFLEKATSTGPVMATAAVNISCEVFKTVQLNLLFIGVSEARYFHHHLDKT